MLLINAFHDFVFTRDFTTQEHSRPATIQGSPQIARVSVGMLYRWMAEGRFKTWTVTRQGYTRAVRYIDETTFEQFPRSHQPRVEEPIGKYVRSVRVWLCHEARDDNKTGAGSGSADMDTHQ